MRLAQVEAAQQAGTPVEYLAQEDWTWLPNGWHDATVSAVDSNKEHPRVWLRVGNSGGVTLEGKKEIKERLRRKDEHTTK